MKRHRWTLGMPYGSEHAPKNATQGDQCEHCGLVREYSHYSGGKGTLRYYRKGDMIAATAGAWGVPHTLPRGTPPCEAPADWTPPAKREVHRCVAGCGYPVELKGDICGECMCEDDGI